MSNENVARSKGPHGEGCACPPEEADAPHRTLAFVSDLAASIRTVVREEKDGNVRLSGLVMALAQEMVAFAHTKDRLILADVTSLRKEVPRRLDIVLTSEVLSRIARDKETIAVDSNNPLESLVEALEEPTARRSPGGTPHPLTAILSAIRG